MKWFRRAGILIIGLQIGLLFASCSMTEEGGGASGDDNGAGERLDSPILFLPNLKAADLQGGKLRVIATTSIIGDVVAQVGGEAIELTTLMEPGQDPHSYEPGAKELTAVADAHVIFVNGWDLEEALVGDLESIGEAVPIIPISANITPLEFDGHNDEGLDEADREADRNHEHAAADPHVWLDVQNVDQWVTNIQNTLHDLDPDNGDAYKSNASAYLAELAELEAYLETRVESLPDDNRFLVTNHGAFNYFARAYGFEVIGTVIPGLSALAEPSATDLSALIAAMEAHQICVIFTETAVSDQLAHVVTEELNFCDEVQVLPLYSGSLSPAGSGADSYIGMMKANVEVITAGLQ